MPTDKTAFGNSKNGKSTQKPRTTGQGFQESQFVQYELSKEQQVSCKSWDFGPEDGWDAMLKLASEGYKVTFRDDERNNCAACWIVSPPGHKHNPNMILPGRGSSPFKAFKQACYKHWSLFDGLWGEYIRSKETEEIDD